MLTECIRSEVYRMLDNYYVNEAALRVEHKTPSPHEPPIQFWKLESSPYITGPIIVSCFTTKCPCAFGSLGQERYSQSKEQDWAT